MPDPAIQRHVLRDDETGVEVAVLSLGAAVQDWVVPTADGPIHAVLGYADPEDYRNQPGYLGVIAGRYANRIAGALFTLGGETFSLAANEGANILHGGAGGWGRCIWMLDPIGPSQVRLSLLSADGDQGFPGNVDVQVELTLKGYALTYDMTATPDRPTPINMAIHSYYNLMGGGPVSGHRLQINARNFTPTGPGLIPTGDILPVNGSRYDYRTSRKLTEAVPEKAASDVNLILDSGAPAAVLTAPNGLSMTIRTDAPGLQLYTGQGLRPHGTPLPGQNHAACTGIALEPQQFPDAPNQPGFPDAIFTPARPFRQTTTIEISP